MGGYVRPLTEIGDDLLLVHTFDNAVRHWFFVLKRRDDGRYELVRKTSTDYRSSENDLDNGDLTGTAKRLLAEAEYDLV